MAEAAGLALGAIGLAGLFSSCLECLNLLETGKGYSRDLSLLCVKYKVEKTRLLIWGESAGIFQDQESYNNSLDKVWIKSVVEEILQQLKLLLNDGSVLKSNYGLQKITGANEQGLEVDRPRGLDDSFESRFQKLSLSLAQTQKRAGTVDKVRWAVKDKRKFTELVDHVRQLVDGLIEITPDLQPRQREKVQEDISVLKDPEDLRLIQEACSASHPDWSEAASDAAETHSISAERRILIAQWLERSESFASNLMSSQLPPIETGDVRQNSTQISSGQLFAARQTQLVPPQRSRWVYLDQHGNQIGPWSGIEMHSLYTDGVFDPRSLLKKVEEDNYENLTQFMLRIGKTVEPFLEPQTGILYPPLVGDGSRLHIAPAIFMFQNTILPSDTPWFNLESHLGDQIVPPSDESIANHLLQTKSSSQSRAIRQAYIYCGPFLATIRAALDLCNWFVVRDYADLHLSVRVDCSQLYWSHHTFGHRFDRWKVGGTDILLLKDTLARLEASKHAGPDLNNRGCIDFDWSIANIERELRPASDALRDDAFQTQIAQDIRSFASTGQSKSVVVVNIPPASSNIQDTWNTSQGNVIAFNKRCKLIKNTSSSNSTFVIRAKFLLSPESSL